MKKRSFLTLIIALSFIFTIFSFSASALETEYYTIEIPDDFSAVDNNTIDDAFWYNEKGEYINISVGENSDEYAVYSYCEEYVYEQYELEYLDNGAVVTADKITYAADLPVEINGKAGYKYVISGINRITGENFLTEHYNFSTEAYNYRFSISTRGENAKETGSAIASTITFPGKVLTYDDIPEDYYDDYYSDDYYDSYGDFYGSIFDEVPGDVDLDDFDDDEVIAFVMVYVAIIGLVIIIPIVAVIIVVIKHSKDEKRRKAQILEMYGRMYQNQSFTNNGADLAESKPKENFAAEELQKEKEDIDNNKNI